MTRSSATTTRAPLAARFWRYQSERFPLAGFAPLITVFTFSSAAYSRLSRGEPGFIRGPLFAVGALTALVFFFLLRVLDEHKDAEVDRRYRPELPVPRGLVTLAELRWIGGAALALVLALNAWAAPALLVPILGVAGWATLMTKEFFVRDWLRAHASAYLLTHMLIMPMIDAYTTGLDWVVARAHAPLGLFYFLAVTFLNGILIEIGRKIRAPEGEREGVDTYTKAWGLRTAPAVWLGALLGSAATAWLATRQTGAGAVSAVLLVVMGVGCAITGADFLRAPSARRSKRIEVASQAWPLFTYSLLGAGPFLLRRFGV